MKPGGSGEVSTTFGPSSKVGVTSTKVTGDSRIRIVSLAWTMKKSRPSKERTRKSEHDSKRANSSAVF